MKMKRYSVPGWRGAGTFPGEVVTLIGSTMYNAFTTYNFTVVGILN
ncbi:MAG: hypothetical protein CM1200mP10_26130 [Candidatus Neomarinimicrobiota bacterium]|nr:MAG: hypothetical protein CM1200mP10_26130 [Candidatus Neomarinimicrobiota bacterium]